MSTPSRGRGRGSTRGTIPPTPRGRGRGRANTTDNLRGRGRGRGSSASVLGADSGGGGLLQKLRTGALPRTNEHGASSASRGRGSPARGQNAATKRGRSALSQTFGTTSKTATEMHARNPSAIPAAPSSYRDFTAQMTEKFQALKPQRDAERKRAIQDGFLADPEKKTSLANAITPVGTCTDMCPEFERVERIVQNMVDKAEKVVNEAIGRDMPSEERMVKRFRRSAAGYDEQLPSDIRTPATLRRTLDYLLDRVIGGGERLASIHKFVWDRTRGIRNDFSIQQVSKAEDVQIAVECYERIARFHILSLHQLSNPDNLNEDENFDAHQEREQLNNTLLSLIYYYDDHRLQIPLPNEPEFRAYCILFELQALSPDIEERMQSWPSDLLSHPKVQTALKLYASAGNTVFEQGPLRPLIPFSIAQANSGKFWTMLVSQQVSYMMACVAEMNFAMVRFTALDALWRSGKNAPAGQQARDQNWTMRDLTEHLAFDDEEQTLEFVQQFGLAFAISRTGDEYLDFTAMSSLSLDRSLMPAQQVFSHEIVESKRYHRTLVAVINGVGVAEAIRQGLVSEIPETGGDDDQSRAVDDPQSMFVPEQDVAKPKGLASSFNSGLNAEASVFTPSSSFNSVSTPQITTQPPFSTKFGEKPQSVAVSSTFGTPSPAFTPHVPSSVSQTPTSFPTWGSGFGLESKANSNVATRPALSNPFQGFKKSEADPSEAMRQPIPSLTFGVPNTALMPAAPATQTHGLPEYNIAGILKLAQSPPKPSMPFTSNQNPTVKSEAKQASPISSFFGEKSLKQQSTSGNNEPNVEVKPSPATAFNFAQTSPPENLATTQPPEQIESLSAASSLPQQPITKPHAMNVFDFGLINQRDSTPQATTQEDTTNMPNSSGPILTATTDAKGILPQTTPFNPQQNKSLATEEFPRPPQSAPVPASIAATTSTTPLSSPKRPQLANFKFPSVSESHKTTTTEISPTSTERVQNPTASISSSSDPPIVSKVIESLSPIKAPVPGFDRKVLVENTAHLALTQSQGLLEYFIGNHVSTILQGVVKQYQKDLHNYIINYVKVRHLSRKYFTLWKSAIQRSVLKKRGRQRRQLLAAALNAEMERKKRNEQELEAILAATQETRRLQEEAKNRNQSTGQVSTNNSTQPTQQKNQQLAGTKRKGITSNEKDQNPGEPVVVTNKSHKRSRTVSTISESSVSTRTPSLSPGLRNSTASARFSQSFFGGSSNMQNFRASLSSRKVDLTKTDYFKLKALGIDPDTPLVPDTAESLAHRQKQKSKEEQFLASRLRSRDHTVSGPSPPGTVPSPMPPPAVPQPRDIQRTSAEPSYSTSKTKGVEEEDEFLKSLREARNAMSQQTEWFKTATASLSTEIQHEKGVRENQVFPKPHQELKAINETAHVNGYKYVVGEVRGRSSLSRTERRIRATGAHGLATKPISSTHEQPSIPSNPRTRAAKPMHKQQISQSVLSNHRKRAYDTAPIAGTSGQQTTSGSGSKRSRGEGHLGDSQFTSLSQHQTTSTRRSKQSFSSSQNMFSALNSADLQGDEQDDLEEEESENHKDSTYIYQNGHLDSDLDEEDDDDDDGDDEDDGIDDGDFDPSTIPEEELVEEEEEEDNDDGYAAKDSAFRYPVITRSSDTGASGVQNMNRTAGASAEDALVLSD